ncbi:MAG: helix-turn-helix transcriptional regulator [Gammaproteobacteria bacterium]|nr:helix-turn-helix transcriptional regulator [Gammaproteobacteria bacterium]
MNIKRQNDKVKNRKADGGHLVTNRIGRSAHDSADITATITEDAVRKVQDKIRQFAQLKKIITYEDVCFERPVSTSNSILENKLLIENRDLKDRIAFLETRDEESFPSEVVEAMISGDSPVMVFRNYRGYSQLMLSEMSGVGRSMIAQIETGKKTGSVEGIQSLAEALGVAMEDLI